MFLKMTFTTTRKGSWRKTDETKKPTTRRNEKYEDEGASEDVQLLCDKNEEIRETENDKQTKKQRAEAAEQWEETIALNGNERRERWRRHTVEWQWSLVAVIPQCVITDNKMCNTTYKKISSYLVSIACFNSRTLQYILLQIQYSSRRSTSVK